MIGRWRCGLCAAVVVLGLVGVRLDGRLLSLVLDQPEAYAPGIEFPGGSWLYRAGRTPADADALDADALDEPVQAA